MGQTNLGSVNLGSSATATVTVTFSAGGTLSKIDVVTRGASGLDFTAAGTGSCQVGTTYSTGQVCTVDVTFKPLFAGSRYGAVVLHSSSALLATGFLQGNGVGPQIAFNPSPTTAMDPPVEGNNGTTGLASPSAMAIDGAGNLYITSSNVTGVAVLPANGGAPSVFDPEAGKAPKEIISSIAIDGAGNQFFFDVSSARVVEVRPDGSTADFSCIAYADEVLYGVAVDGAGDLFCAVNSPSQILEFPGGNSQAAVNAITADDQSLADPAGLAVDASGNLFIADPLNNRVVELTAAQVKAGRGIATAIDPVVDGTGLSRPARLTFDGVGDLFIADTGNSRIVVVPANGAAAFAIQPAVKGLGLAFPEGLALDQAGNLFIADTDNNRIVGVQRSQPPKLAFAITTAGSVAAESPQTVQVQSVGTGPLVLSGITYPADFPEYTGGTDACSVSISLSPGQMCNLNIDFAPSSAETFIENVTLTDNSLNKTGATQNVGVSGMEIEGQILVSPTSLSFGSQISETVTASQQFTLTNETTLPLLITGIQVTGPNASVFTFGNNCPASLAVGASCIIHGHYAPSLPETDTAAVTITYRGGISQSIPLSGTCLYPPEAYLYNVTSLSFGTEQVGAPSASQRVKLLNEGGTALQIVGIKVTGPNASSFIFESDCPASLEPPSYCDTQGHFAPTTTGPLTATLTFIFKYLPSETISLSGTGISSPLASLSASSLSFGDQQVGTQSASKSVTLTNVGSVPLQITNLQTFGANVSSFVFSSDCPASLSPSSTCTIHGHFAPTTTGPLTAYVNVSYNGYGPSSSITLTGAGVSPSAASLSANSLSFGDQQVGTQSGSKSVTLTNVGSVPLQIVNLQVLGANASSFVFASNCPPSFAAGSSCTIHGHFAPTTTGPLAAVVTVSYCGYVAPQSVTLTGTGTSLSAPVSPSEVGTAAK